MSLRGVFDPESRRSWIALLVVWLVTCDVVVVEARPEPKYKSCGPHLAARISLVCSGTYNAAPGRVRRGIVDDCCWNECSNSQIGMYCRSKAPVVEPSPEEVEDIRESPAFKFHFGPGSSRNEESQKVIAAVTKPPTRVTKSKLVIGRVPQDYVRGWTYAG